ncbi:glycosyltransferase family 2 protein [Actinoalloteichus sp. AHMU CJ021]|uniref:Glycosyl transferase family 2 n=1 Tax=Actinoalloteichus caeruleus DSM 43889 TaxID=1120930 RepID=A0ABT1JL67_ACTCY|nr:glycosyltransferase family A protein [Actinoalloteichus caeruleus]AUS79029.1 glycosyltransferase family 2 protein [Actinoalloteichus sp. AHMU CJ021]MCP2333265.1 Glycosyl transferase family 2 [Actinoalloteichus caeruleus DSM 43889]
MSDPVAAPPISVGLPVRNGEPYLEAALRSLLDQRDVDYELIVADNCSTDATADIVGDLARGDARVRYLRRARDIGVMGNHNRLVGEARGGLFAWAAADDVWRPDRLARLAAALADRPEVVLASSSATEIGPDDGVLGSWHNECRVDHPDPAVRVRDLLEVPHHNYYCYGLVRRHVLASTMLNPPIKAGDRVLVAELALRGPFVHLDEELLLHRIHPDRISERVDPREFYRSQRPGRRSLVLPNVEEGGWFLRAVLRSPLSPGQRLAALAALRPWLRDNAVPMARNVARAAVDAGRRLAGAADRSSRPRG